VCEEHRKRTTNVTVDKNPACWPDGDGRMDRHIVSPNLRSIPPYHGVQALSYDAVHIFSCLTIRMRTPPNFIMCSANRLGTLQIRPAYDIQLCPISHGYCLHLARTMQEGSAVDRSALSVRLMMLRIVSSLGIYVSREQGQPLHQVSKCASCTFIIVLRFITSRSIVLFRCVA